MAARLLGAVYAPLNTADSHLSFCRRQPTNPNVIGLANSSDDTVQFDQAGRRIRLTANGAQFAAYVLFLEHVQSITLKAAQGLLLANRSTGIERRDARMSKRFEEKIGHPPDWDPAMSYSAVSHY